MQCRLPMEQYEWLRYGAFINRVSMNSIVLEAIDERKLKVEIILLTHSHGDHILEVDRLKERTGAEAWINEKESIAGARSFTVGKRFEVGALSIETRSTWGHSPGGVTYVVRGLARTVAIVGDALFAGSMGGRAIAAPVVAMATAH